MRSWPAAPGINPNVYESWRITPAIRPLKQDVVGSVGNVLWVVMGTIGIVMLIVCANVANLLLVRAQGRQQGSSPYALPSAQAANEYSASSSQRVFSLLSRAGYWVSASQPRAFGF